MKILDLLRRRPHASDRPPPAPGEPDVRVLEDRFQRMVEISADAIISVDEAHRIILFNQGAEEIFGYGRDEVMGLPLNILIPERFRRHHDVHLRDFAHGERHARRMGERREIAGLRKGGIEFPAEASISRLETPDGPNLTVMLRDVTDRKKAEETQRFLADASEVLARSMDYATTLAELARFALPELGDWCVIDVLRDGRLERVAVAHADPDLGPLVRRLTAYPPDRNRPHPSATVLETGEPELITEVSSALIDAIAVTEDHRSTLLELAPACIFTVPLVARGRTLGALALFSADSSRPYGPDEQLLAIELARRAALAADNARLYQEAQQAIAARDEILSIVSHDLGNPLSAIRVATRVLGRRLEAGEVRDATEHLDGIRTSALQMERLIRDLLDVRRIESGRLRLVPRPERIADLVAEAARSMRDVAEDEGVELRTRLEPGLPDSLRVDADRIQQVFSNLIANAVRYSPAGSVVTIRAAPADGGGVVFTVEDMGPGIADADLPHVFDRFWQAHQRGSHGLGLGLAIVQGITEAHGGHVAVDSQEGIGARFSFAIPAGQDD